MKVNIKLNCIPNYRFVIVFLSHPFVSKNKTLFKDEMFRYYILQMVIIVFNN